MHRIATESGDLAHEKESNLIEQTPADILFLSAADTDLACVAQTWGTTFGDRLRVAHAGALQQPNAVEHYADNVIVKAKLVIFRLLGGKAYFSDLLDELEHLRAHHLQARILLLPGTDTWDTELLEYGDYAEPIVKQIFSYFKEGGIDNIERAGQAIQLLLDNQTTGFPEAIPMPKYGWYQKKSAQPKQENQPIAWVCFYRALQQVGDLAVVDALWESLEEQGFFVEAFYAYSLREPEAQEALLQYANESQPNVVLTLQSFSICINAPDRVSFLEILGCPILQVPVSSHDRHTWEHDMRGITPSDVAMNVALPEIDGRIFSSIIGFKEEYQPIPEIEFTVKSLRPDLEQVSYVAKQAKNWAKLQEKENSEKKIAIILANYPTKTSRIGNGVGLDTPASVVKFLRVLEEEGYNLGELPEDSKELMEILQEGVTNDAEANYGKTLDQWLEKEDFQNYFNSLPEKSRNKIAEQWTHELPEYLGIAGKQFGNVFVGIQPQRGFGIQDMAIYHDPKLSPPPEYLAFYYWIREHFHADAIIHFGKHGNLEWLPGKSVALGKEDFPRICIGTLPHLYPFIVNNPGEGTQAKRRTSAVIVDHLTPPLTRAGLYEDLDKIERLVEEHAHCETLYPERADELEHEIEHLLDVAPWKEELPEDADILNALSNYLCDIKESQIRSGLHIFGQNPEGERKIDFILSLLRMPLSDYPGLLHSLLGKTDDFDVDSLPIAERDTLELKARTWIEEGFTQKTSPEGESEALSALRDLLHREIIPRVLQCQNETKSLLAGLDGKFISPGPAGAPTRGRIDVLPTGRNFFSIDPRVIPTRSAWKCGKQLADQLLKRHHEEHNEYPQTVAMVIWGTSNMRTGGDDLAQALWLWGCEPVWEKVSGRIIDFKIWPVELLNRPRVDVLLRVSGLFRDAFGETMQLLATIPKRLAELDEPAELNPIRAAFLEDQKALEKQGLPKEEANRLSHLRVFSSGPGCYGTGLLPLIDAGNWETREDITNVFLKWGSYAYDTDGSGTEQTELLRTRLGNVEVVHQNQDNREHDILDSDDYFQFQGGLSAAIETIRGEAPVTYHGDSSRPDHVKIRTLKEEFNRVFRSRVLNPKWIEAMRNHGYKGAFEVSATIDYMFGYDATCDLVADYQYDEVAQKLLLDEEQQEFFKEYNPAALQDAVQRLLEANERDMWKDADDKTIEELELTLMELQGQLE